MAKVKNVDEETFSIFCPGCGTEHKMPKSKFRFNGDYDSPTITPFFFQEETKKNPACRFYIQFGRIKFTKESTHKLSGRNVELPHFNKRDLT